MKELVHQQVGFSRSFGWNDDNAWGLVWKCLMYMQHLDKKRFRMFYCAVDLAAWRRLRAETYQIPDPIELCNQCCSEIVMAWYLVRYPGILNPLSPSLHYFFDRNEYFKQPFEDKWNAELAKLDFAKGEWNIWRLVEKVSAVEMKNVPGVQAADILAWGVNRENTVSHDAPGKSLPEIMRTVIPSGSIVWDEARMRQKFSPLIHLR